MYFYSVSSSIVDASSTQFCCTGPDEQIQKEDPCPRGGLQPENGWHTTTAAPDFPRWQNRKLKPSAEAGREIPEQRGNGEKKKKVEKGDPSPLQPSLEICSFESAT